MSKPVIMLDLWFVMDEPWLCCGKTFIWDVSVPTTTWIKIRIEYFLIWLSLSIACLGNTDITC